MFSNGTKIEEHPLPGETIVSLSDVRLEAPSAESNLGKLTYLYVEGLDGAPENLAILTAKEAETLALALLRAAGVSELVFALGDVRPVRKA